MKKFLVTAFFILLFAAGVAVAFGYWVLAWPNIKVGTKTTLALPPGSDFNALVDSLEAKSMTENTQTFLWAARLMKFNKVKPGYYVFEENYNNVNFIRKMRSGDQQPKRVVVKSARSLAIMAGKVASYFYFDSTALYESMIKAQKAEKFDLSFEHFPLMFIPNTYEFYWTATPDEFLARMHKEYQQFWNEDRKAKAAELGLSPEEVGVLASIVQEETSFLDEMPTVAGVYLNRLQKGMKLEADPTVKFLIKDREVRRVYYKDLEIVSPYNTYLNYGLPPGPLVIPDVQTIASVLNAEEHDFIFFCAKADFSGRHVFAKSKAVHDKNAAAYRRAANERNIR